jgi:hypothetical protein
MAWEVRIDGPGAILHKLAIAISDEDIRLENRDGVFNLSGARLDLLTDATNVRREADRITMILSASARLSFGSTESLQVGDVSDTSETSAARALNNDGPSDLYLWARQSTLSKSVREALLNPGIEEALRLRNAADLDWPELLQIYHVIEQATGGKKAVANSYGVTVAAINGLREAASGGTPSKSAGRHDRARRPPATPLTLAEARSLVDRLLMAWLAASTRRNGRTTFDPLMGSAHDSRRAAGRRY